jgi:hypothetical protein
MRGGIPPLPQYVFMMCCLSKRWIRLSGVIAKYRKYFSFTLHQYGNYVMNLCCFIYNNHYLEMLKRLETF